jgi:tagatose 1,6-diphosphate aldolase
MKTELTPGRWRGLKGTSRQGDRFAVLAFDQRGSYRKMLPEGTPFDAAVQIKKEVVSSLSRHTSAVLLDYIYGHGPAMELANDSGLLLALEKSGYTGESTYRHMQIESEWSVAKIKRFGASAVKLLVYYNPEIEDLAPEIEELVSRVVQDAHAADIPVFLEPLTYSADSAVEKKSPEFAAIRPRLIIETARRLSALGPDILKMEFPVDIFNDDADTDQWARHCRELTKASTVPWVLLSAGVDFEDFERQLEVALKSGASGYLAGRAIWKESVTMEPKQRAAFLEGTARERTERLNALVDTHAVPWTEYYSYAQTDDSWYTRY